MTTTESKNKAIVLEAFDTLFNKRDYAAAERFWSDRYIQHSAHIPPGREGLFDLVKKSTGNAEIRKSVDPGEWRFPDAARSILGAWCWHTKLDRRGHRAD